MNVQSILKSFLDKMILSSVNGKKVSLILYVVFVFAILIKVLWGYWERDLTFGDTSSYFKHAVLWHLNSQVNIVWSPLYTAYFGSWLSITENASIATFLHRMGLILVSTILVAWLGYLSLPRVLALLLVVWWVALPIHYDTLYEVHLFGALPILVMALVSLVAGDKWRNPFLLSVAIISTILVRNEYIIVICVLAALSGVKFVHKMRSISFSEMKLVGLRYGTTFALTGLLIVYFYSASYIQGALIAEESAPKHTLNMCQVYAYGYQQQHSDWSGSPWTDCLSLMQKKFGTTLPSLREMIASNPGEVVQHFLWNLSLTRAGLEVLLFNATSARDNPDYAPVYFVPVLPSALLGFTLLLCVGGTALIFGKSSKKYVAIREKLFRLGPLLLAVVIMEIAVILTQRPRPSYLLGAGVLYIWVVLVMLNAFMAQSRKLDSVWIMSSFVAVLLLVMPSYQALSLPSKNGALGDIYNELRPHASMLCELNGGLAVNEYGINVVSYLCSPYNLSTIAKIGKPDIGSLSKEEREEKLKAILLSLSFIDISVFSEEARSTPEKLADGLEMTGARALIVDPYMLTKYPGLLGCPELRNVLLERGWQQLAYSVRSNGGCIAAYAK
ncbi:hypothetical protein [Methylomonas rapida]|uniref:Glycosyltransferase RgtA/B/C/D-like domain-containing protein n=1 Tax=Methylomonas rapida TaxID=2963939 RepID=A0ABY7GQ30_9GAMM|nr:hypothetical protein [Methylomonas rapida]WAR46605.1 hypothetical protein NM686_008845 [Methylomonas rapida]